MIEYLWNFGSLFVEFIEFGSISTYVYESMNNRKLFSSMVWFLFDSQQKMTLKQKPTVAVCSLRAVEMAPFFSFK